MTDKWPSPYEQLSAVLAAPIPFFVAVVIIAWAAWVAWRWRFKAVFEKQSELYDLSRLEVGHQKDLAERTVKELTAQFGMLQKERELNAEHIAEIERLTARLTGELNQLGQANSSPTSPTSRPGIWPRGSEVMDWTSSGWRRRNPTDATGGSG
jgi:hypothetical protein